MARAHELAVRQNPPPAILLGRHLLDMGLAPGPLMGAILDAASEAQLEGAFADLEGARHWAAAELKNADQRIP